MIEAANIDKLRSARPVISMTKAMPVSGARTIAENRPAIPTIAQSTGETAVLKVFVRSSAKVAPQAAPTIRSGIKSPPGVPAA